MFCLLHSAFAYHTIQINHNGTPTWSGVYYSSYIWIPNYLGASRVVRFIIELHMCVDQYKNPHYSKNLGYVFKFTQGNNLQDSCFYSCSSLAVHQIRQGKRRACEVLIEWTNARVTVYVREWMFEWISVWVNEWRCDWFRIGWVSAWVSERWVSESEYVSESVSVSEWVSVTKSVWVWVNARPTKTQTVR